MCLKALDGIDETGDIDDIIKSIKYAEENGSSICCLGFSSNKYNEELKKVMSNSNMLFVVAAGNESEDLDKVCNTYPACYHLDNVITVGDIRCDGNISLTSNYGENTVDLFAPGTDIVSTIRDNK